MTPPGPRRVPRALAAAVSVSLVASGAILARRVLDPPRGDPDRPDVILVLTDDQRLDAMRALPQTRRLIGERGVTFENAFVTNSVCCPSRASILTGQYSKTTGVWGNRPPHGGWSSFDDRVTIATRLQEHGYHTAHVGKYLNGYYGPYVPPGWDEWVAFSGVRPYRQHDLYYRYYLNDRGTLEMRGAEAEDYSTDVLADEVEAIIRNTRGPLFLQFAPFAPHTPSTPAPRDRDAFADLEPYRPPSFDERDVSDKPRWVRELDPIGSSAGLDRLRRRMLQSLLSVDRAVVRIVEALRDTERLANALIVFTSDNGYSLGEHRWTNKQSPYEEDIRVPMLVRFDPLVRSPRRDGRLVLNIDLAPTFAEIAGTSFPEADGRSLVPLLRDPAAAGRSDFLLEHQNFETPRVPAYCGVRDRRFTYVRYVTREEELYDLREDPYQLRNVADTPEYAAALERLRARLGVLCVPPPPAALEPFP